MQIIDGFGFTEEHELLRDSARRLLQERCPLEEVRRLSGDELGYDSSLWKEIANLGWAGIAVAEEYGGAELGSLHLALLFEETGRCVLPSPLLGQTLSGIAIQCAGDEAQRARYLPSIAAGETIATLALTDDTLSWEPEQVGGTAEPTQDGYSLRGAMTHVLNGPWAERIVAPFRCSDSGELALFVVDVAASGVAVRPEVGLDPTRRTARVSFGGVSVSADARLAADGQSALHEIHRRALVLLAAEMAGGADGALLLTRDYAIDRKQFGRQIGSFQAVKHPLAEALMSIEQARSLTYAAAAELDHAKEASDVLPRMAKARASDAYFFIGHRAIQFHGGFGFTLDCDAHFFLKRAIWSRAALGDASHHRKHLAGELFGDSGIG